MNELKVNLGYVPRPWQAKCHKSMRRFSVLALHRRAGKTELAVMELISAALRTDLSMALFVYMAPYLKQAKAIAWDRLKHYSHMVPGVEVNEAELWIRFPHNRARIQIFGGDNPDGLRGLRLDGVVVDEVAQIKPEVWNEIVQPALSDRKGWALFIGTPKGINLFSELFFKARDLRDWYSDVFTVYDTDALDPDEVERLKRDMPENEFSREYLCDFSAAAENQLLSIGVVEEAARRVLREDQIAFSARILGVDVARFGDDKSVIIRRQGLQAFPPLVFHGLDNMAFASRVAQEIHDWTPDAVFVDAGNGAGVIDRLRQLGHAVIEVNFGGKPIDPHYSNKRTEMHFLMKRWVEQDGGAIPNRPSLKQDMATPTYSYNSKNQIVLESKDDIKERLLRSPDESDALALTFAFPVAPSVSNRFQEFATFSRVVTDYDPFDGRER